MIRKVWWCEEHGKPADKQADGTPLDTCDNYILVGKDHKPCEVVEVRIVSGDALIIERDENGEYTGDC